MSFLFPGFLLAAGAVAAGAVFLHFIVTREPDQLELPTARFAPPRVIQARARQFEPRDLLLLAIRVALVLAVGAALAGPVIAPSRRDLARIVMLDRSRALANPAEASDSARALLRAGDQLILFDSSATLIERAIPDTLDQLTRSSVPGRISSALIAALRTASRIRDRADSIELVVVSPLAGEEVDVATDSIRALWPAGIRLVPLVSRPVPAPPLVTLESKPDDPLGVALPPAAGSGAAGAIRVLRRPAGSTDSDWARQVGRVLVVWPADSAVPPGWTARKPDTAGAVMAAGAVVVAPFLRWSVRAEVVSRPSASGPDLVVARWVDGVPAAVESPLGEGCIRTVTIPVPAAGDLVLDPRFGKLVRALLQPCGGATDFRPVDTAGRRRLAGTSQRLRAGAAGLASAERMDTPWSKWLLIAALVLLGLEALARRRAAA